MATGLRAKTFTLVNIQDSGSTIHSSTLVYTCPADKYANVLLGYFLNSGGQTILISRAIPSGFTNDRPVGEGVGPNDFYEKGDGTVFPTPTVGEPKFRLYPGDRIRFTNVGGSYEYRIIVEEVSAF